jgi:VWFA-related protein
MRCLGLLAGSAFLAGAQSDEVHVSAHVYTPPQVRLTVQSQLVQLEVVVRDPRGHAVSGLKQGDFEILDEGKTREIAAFSVVTHEAAPAPVPAAVASASTTTASASAPAAAIPPPAPPRSTLLFFDDLHQSPAELQRTQIAARSFIREGLGPGGRAAIYAASEGLILDFTADAGALTAAIQKLRSHQHVSENGLQPCPRITPYQAYLIANNLNLDALNAAIQEAQQCANADSSSPLVTGRNPSLMSARRPPDPNMTQVQAQASATWQQVRTDSLNSFDAVGNAMTLLARAPGTRVLLMVSSGFLTGLLDEQKDAAIDRAIHAGIVINALDAKGLWSEAPGRPFGETQQTTKGFPHAASMFEASTIGSRNAATDAVMAEFASGTGGLFFHDNNDLAGGFAQLGAVPETTYLVAFRPDTEGGAGKYHKLKVRLTAGNGDYVQTRPGYVTPGNVPAAGQTVPRPIDREALATDVMAEIPVQLSARFGKQEKGDPTLSLLIHVDLAKLNFIRRDGRHVQKLMFIGALLDAGGKMVAAKEGAMDLALKDDTWARLTASGINATLGFPAPSGPCRVRVVVQDADGKMASLNQTVEIPQ